MKSLLTETKFGLNDLKKFGYKLYVEDNSSEITIYLIDEENSTHGVIVTEVIGSSKSTVHEVVRVAADGGWGPLMYEAAMAYNTDNDKNLNKLIKEYVKELIEALRDLIWNVKNLRK